MEKGKLTTVTFETLVYEAIIKEAKKQERSISRTINNIVKEYFKQEERKRKNLEGYDRLRSHIQAHTAKGNPSGIKLVKRQTKNKAIQ